MLSERNGSSADIAVAGPLRVRQLSLDWQKLDEIWRRLNRFRTLFSDLTRGDVDNYLRFVTLPGTLWLEIVNETDELVGLITVEDLHQITDAQAHVVYFDRSVADKEELGKKVLQWLFENFPLKRLTVRVPSIYYATVRHVKTLGFQQEGRLRSAVLIGGRWVDVLIFGVLREEVCRS